MKSATKTVAVAVHGEAQSGISPALRKLCLLPVAVAIVCAKEPQPGAGVVTSRGDVHYVITEHGVAYLHGKTLRQRVEALIGIADPKFRADLEDFARRSKLLISAHAMA